MSRHRLRAVAEALGGIVASAFIDELQSILARLLSEADPRRVARLVEEDVDLVQRIWSRLPESYRRLAVRIARANADKLAEKLTVETIINAIIESGRTDIASIFINDPEAMKWLRRQVEEARRILGIQA